MALPSTNSVQSLLEGLVADGAFPGASFAFGNLDSTNAGAVGGIDTSSDSPRVTTTTRFDLASLTKVIGTTLSAMRLEREGVLDIRQPVTEIVPGFRHTQVTVAHLLRHTSGLPAYLFHFAQEASQPSDVWGKIFEAELEQAPGSKVTYSCLGFILLRLVLEKVSGQQFESVVAASLPPEISNRVRFNPADVTSIPPTGPVEDWMLTRRPGLTGRYLQGVVHDPLAFAQDGVSGNAGLFASVSSLAILARWILPQLDTEQWQTWTSREVGSPGRGLGWDIREPSGGTVGLGASPATFGHLGFTGTSFWIEPVRREFAVLLTNRVHPNSENVKIGEARIKFHSLIWSSERGNKDLS